MRPTKSRSTKGCLYEDSPRVGGFVHEFNLPNSIAYSVIGSVKIVCGPILLFCIIRTASKIHRRKR